MGSSSNPMGAPFLKTAPLGAFLVGMIMYYKSLILVGSFKYITELFIIIAFVKS